MSQKYTVEKEYFETMDGHRWVLYGYQKGIVIFGLDLTGAWVEIDSTTDLNEAKKWGTFYNVTVEE